MSANRGRRSLRWMIGVGSTALLMTGAVDLAAGPSAGAAASAGVGSSYAQSLQVTPHDGSLAVGVVLGEALAGHTNNIARAQSQGVDLGSIGLSLQGYNCGTAPSAQQKALVPQPLQAETGQPGAAQGETRTADTGLSSISPTNLPPTFGSTEHVMADNTPHGEADTTYAPIDGGAFSVTGMTSKAWSGLIGGQRVAGASSDIGAISLVNSAVVLKNMHWQVEFPSGGSAPPTGSFSIGQVLVAGHAVPTPDPSAVASAVNAALGALGIKLILPSVSLVQGVEFVSPLQLEVVPNANRDTILNAVLVPALKALHPLLHGLEDGFGPPEPAQLAAALCQSDTPITVADITLASVDGGGYFSAAFGGVNASSGEPPANPFKLNLPSLGPIGSTQFVAGTESIPGTPAVPGTPGSAPSALSSSASPVTRSGSSGGGSAPVALAKAVGHAPHGPLLAIGLGGLGLLGLLAEGDRRTIRRGQSSVNFDKE